MPKPDKFRPKSREEDTIQTSRAELIGRLRRADRTPRCMHVKINGVRCGSPALRNQPFCYFHNTALDTAYDRVLPPLEDANAVQLAIMKVLNSLLHGGIDRPTATALLYGLQTAVTNLRRVNFDPPPESVVLVDPLDELHAYNKLRVEMERKGPQVVRDLEDSPGAVKSNI